MTMNAQQATRYGVRPETGRRAGIKIGACAIVIGLSFAVARHVAVRPADTKEHVAGASGLREDKPTRLQAAIDASPAFEGTLATKSDLRATVIPTLKPVASQKRTTSSADGRRVAARGKMPQGVLRFDRCIPKCETQDPLIVGYSGPSPDPAVAQSTANDAVDVGFDLSSLHRAGHLLGRTVAMPRAALRKGRDIIYGIVRSD
ncbi:hypothetical protein [Pararhizobium sp. A13]|uniref:hypothetical protein n=1 Tax=Pararhizobium sp. A13 TaxID=3133975 RepID=UPI00311AEF72